MRPSLRFGVALRETQRHEPVHFAREPPDVGVPRAVGRGREPKISRTATVGARIAKNELGEECYASPALAQGRIYIRTSKSLFCIGEGSK